MSERASIEARIDAALARADELEPDIAALIAEEDRRGRLRGAVDDLFARFPDPAERPPLFGTLFGVKDIFHVDGLPTRAGSRLPAAALAGAEATSVRQLREAGAIVLAKTVTTEFAYFGPGPTRNPRNPAHTPGGSSSGSAAAVAAGYCPIALGTQTIGSINRPAAFCGVFGFKPTHERISRAGVIPLSTTLDHIGLLAAGLDELRTAASVLLGTTPAATAARPRLGLPTGPYLERASDEALRDLEAAAKRLTEAGYEIRPLETLRDFAEIETRHTTIVAYDAAATHAEWFDAYPDLYHPKTRELIEHGRTIAGDTYRTALAERERLRVEIIRLMDEHAIDLWITPSAPGPAPSGIESTGDPIMNLPWTQVGLPTLTLPTGADGAGLPLGLQLVASWSRDEELLAHGSRLAPIAKAS